MAKPHLIAVASSILAAVALTGCQHANAVSDRSRETVPVVERLVDSFCAGGYCERVYTRYSDAELQGSFWAGSRDGVPFEPYIVRVEADSANRTARP